MIARIWHGCVSSEKLQEYLALIHREEIPDIRAVPGNQGVQVMARSQGPLTYLLIVTYWRDRAAIRSFVGDDIDVARYYPHDKDYLVEFETHVIHYEIIDDIRENLTGF